MGIGFEFTINGLEIIVFGISGNTGESRMLEVDLLFEIGGFACGGGGHLWMRFIGDSNRIDNTISSVTKVKLCSLS